MGKYKFLTKPLFYILSLLFSCWMVLQIEQISPSDFGRYKSLFEQKKPNQTQSDAVINTALRDAYYNYKTGKTDSAEFFRFIEETLMINKQERGKAK